MLRTVSAMSACIILLSASTASCLGQGTATTGGLSQADLEEMLGPIALYPDSLLANVLAASVYPDEVAQAAKSAQQGLATDAASRQWEPPVQAMAKVPEVLSMLAENLDWTTAIGQAYLVQPGDVAAAVQSLRAKAQQNGSLQSNEQQTVVRDGSAVVIESAEPQVVYVPQYNPEVVYSEPSGYQWGAVAAGAVSFGAGVAVGAVLDNVNWDWDDGNLSWGSWGGYGDVDIDRSTDISRDITTGDISVANRPRPGNEGQRWTPNGSKVPAENGRFRTDKLDQFRGERGRQAMNQVRTSTARPSVAPGGIARAPSARPYGQPGGTARVPSGRPSAPPAGAAQARPPLKKVSPPRSVPPMAGAGSYRPAAPSPRRAAVSPTSRAPSRTPSAFNRSGGSKASVSRGSSSRGRSSAAGGRRGGGGGRGRR